VERGPQGQRAPYLSLIIPAYNEGTRLGTTLRTVTDYLAAQPYDWELIVVDDGSDDDTLALATAFAAAHPDLAIRPIANPHRGKAFTDADLATPIDTLALVIPHFADGGDVVIGSREGVGAIRRDEPAYRHLMGRVFNGLVQLVALPGIQDTQCGFKVLRGPVARELFAATRLYDEKSAAPRGPAVTGFDVELLYLARRHGYRIAEVPVEWQYVAESKVNPIRDTVRNVRDLLMVRVNSLLGRYR
jgi:dolichyl-phosphate beta-glucosyltransferase